jgi:hypothetical protein
MPQEEYPSVSESPKQRTCMLCFDMINEMRTELKKDGYVKSGRKELGEAFEYLLLLFMLTVVCHHPAWWGEQG